MRTIEAMVVRAMRDALERDVGFASVPYLPHPLEVCRLVLECGGSQIAACAAVLHEVVGIGRMSLSEVAERYGAETARLIGGEGDEALLLSCADRTDHLLRRSRLGLADSLARDLNQLHLAMRRLDADAREVLMGQLEGLLPTPTPTARRRRSPAKKSISAA